jgi:hypothetical protein
MKYLLLNPLKASDFGCTTAEMLEAIKEFGCSYIFSLDNQARTITYAIANTKEALENMVNTVDLDGSIVGYTNIYDQVVEEV